MTRSTDASATRSIPVRASSLKSSALISGSEADDGLLGDGVHVLVAAAGQIHQQDLVFRHARRDFRRLRQRVAGFQRRDDALVVAQVVKGLERFIVGNGGVLGAARVLQPGMLRPDARVVAVSYTHLRLDDLAVLVLQ